MSIRSLLAPAVVSLLLTVSVAHAAPIFTQNVASNTAYPSELEFDTLIADDFSIAANDTVRSVSWHGAYAFDNSAPAADGFEIRFYADAAGEPGALLQTFVVGNAVSRTAIGLLGPVTEYGYIADLGAGFDIAAGTTYWLVIANDTASDDDNWYWSVQTGGGNVQLTTDAGASWGTASPAAATYFALDNAVVVPEPSSLLLIGLGLAAVMRRTRAAATLKAARSSSGRPGARCADSRWTARCQSSRRSGCSRSGWPASSSS